MRIQLIGAPFPSPMRLGCAHIPVGDDGNALAEQFLHRIAFQTGPFQLDPGGGVGEANAQREGVDARNGADDGVVGHVADAAFLGHGSGDSAGDELALMDAGVIGAYACVGHGQGAVEHPHLRILGSDLAASADHGRRGGKDHLRAVRHGFFHGFESILVGALVDEGGHFVAHDGLEVLPAQLVGSDPRALFGGKGMDEGHIQVSDAAKAQ